MDKINHPKHITTKILHSGFIQESNKGHHVPVYLSSSYRFDNSEEGAANQIGRYKGFNYLRYGTPNSQEVELKIAELECDGLNMKASAILCSSGMAAISTLFLACLKADDTVLCSFPIYGGTQSLMNHVLIHHKINSVFMKFNDLEKVEDVLNKNDSIKLIHIESPANPTLTILDVDKICQLARKYNKKISIDSTFATPYLQQPFKYGMDFIIHSCTKFLNGHGTGVSGIIVGKDIEFMETKVLHFQRMMGCNSNPMDSFLLSTGLKTLAIRMEKQYENAMIIAQFLENHKEITKVNYPGLKSHIGHELAKKQMRNFGAVMSYEIKGGYSRAEQFYNSLKLCIRAVSLGTVDTLICHSASTTHRQLTKEQREEQEITDGLVRMSVGLENPNDIIRDLNQALQFTNL